MTSRIAQLDLHLPGLLKLLGEHLYSDRRVAFRELVQNAHDSVIRRRVECGDHAGDAIRITLDERGGRTWVTFADRGLGLTEQDIERFLSTVGRGQTSELRRALEDGSGDARQLIGKFGVGLLSAFMIGDRVVVTTRRAGTEEGWRWTCDGQQTYHLEPADVAWEGTEVAVRIRAEFEGDARPRAIEQTLAHYAGWLETPIFVGPRRINPRGLPWSGADATVDIEAIATALCEDREPLAVIALRPFAWSGRTIELHGVLATPPRSEVGVREYGNARVLVRRMLVEERDTTLLPVWARFVTALVDCPQLESTASRESVRHDEVYQAVRDAIARQLLEAITSMEERRPFAWRRVIEAHEPLIKKWAVREPALFDAVAHRLTFRTSRGRTTLPEYLEASGGTLYYFESEEQARTMGLVLESSSRPVIDAQWFAEAEFLRAYASIEQVPIVREDSELGGLIRDAEPSDALRPLLAELSSSEITARAVRFEPRAVPALLTAPRRALLADRLQREDEEGPLAGLVSDFKARAGTIVWTLHVNVDNPLIQKLAAMPSDARAPALVLVREIARLTAGDRLDPARLASSIGDATAAVGALLARRP